MRSTMTFALILKSSTFSLGRAAASSSSRSEVCSTMQSTMKRSFSTDSPYHTIAITGSTGLVGKALLDELSKRESVNGKAVRIVRLQRAASIQKGAVTALPDEASVSSLPWNPKASGEDNEPAIDPGVLPSIDTVVHLAGENVGTGLGPLGFLGIRPWTEQKKAAILDSRTGPTKAIASTVASSSNPITLISASGVGAYGDNFIKGKNCPSPADESVDISNTHGFLAEVSRQWESATAPAAEIEKHRVVNARIAPVLSKEGGALQKLYLVFFMGGGGIIGSGLQYFSYISARDVARAIVHIMETPSLSGPVNVCAPKSVTNAEFTKALGKVMGRPTILPFPGFAVNLMFGEMGNEMLLGGVNAVPKKLVDSGFQFQHETIDRALESAINEETI